MMKDTVLSKLEEITAIPTLPAVVANLRELMRGDAVDAAKIASIVEDDMAIVARILRLVNSAYYALPEPIDTLCPAVARLGQTAVENVVLAAAVLDVFPVRSRVAFDRKKFWMHGICTGAAANVVSQHSNVCRDNCSPDVLHLVGVIHDIGKVVYEQYFHNELMDVLRLTRDTKKPMYEVERMLMHTDHAETGGWLAKKWGLPDAMVAGVRWHHMPCHAPEEFRCLAGVCHLANYLCNKAGLGDGGDSLAPHLDPCVFEGLGIDPLSCEEMIEEIAEKAKESELLGMLD
jgi:HD-like signal output (HDOD) protein